METKRILIVDDEESIRNILTRMMLGFGCSIVETTNSISDAIWKFSEKHYDVLITDVNMPDTSGLFLVRHVKEFFSDCKIIAISGDYAILEDAKKLGAACCIVKPFTSSEVMETLKD